MPQSANEARDVSYQRFGHNFNDVQVESPSFKQSSPLFLSGPGRGAYHTCPPRVQAKLKIGQPDDKYEQEADRVAEQVTCMSESRLQRQVLPGEESEYLQTKPPGMQAPLVSPSTESQIFSLNGKGQHLPDATRAFFEPRFGHDFGRVRIHTGSQAVTAARAINARAFTIKRDVVFGFGQFTPGTTAGRRLMAHELTHVIQQGATVPQHAGSRRVQRYPISTSRIGAPLVQRRPGDEKEPQTFGKSPPGVGDYVPDRPTIPIKKTGHKLITSGKKQFTYDEWLTSGLGRKLTAQERAAFERGCVGLMLLRLGYPDKSWPWEIPGNECWLTELKALQRQKALKTKCNGYPPVMYAFQTDGGWKTGKEPNEKQKRGEESVDPKNAKMVFMPNPDYNLWNFATRHKDAWEWMNHAKIHSKAVSPWRVRVRKTLPGDLGMGKPVLTIYGLACPKVPTVQPSSKTPAAQPTQQGQIPQQPSE